MPKTMRGSRTRKMLGALLAAATFSAASSAQVQSRNSLSVDPLYGSVTTQQPITTAIPLSLDDAIRRGLQYNLQVVLSTQDQQVTSGERLQAIGYLIPDVTWQAQRSRSQINLEAEGFRPSVLSSFPPGFLPPSAITNFEPLVTANVVAAQAVFKQTLFDLRAFELYRAAKQEVRAADFRLQSARGAVIQAIADSYLLVLADEANVADARGRLETNKEILRQAILKHQAGTVAKLDELRARVQYQQQEQVLIAQQNDLEKAKIVLNRQIGLPADQPIQLTDTTPYAYLEVMPLDTALREAYSNRQEYLYLQAKLRSAEFQRRGARYERMPTLSFSGNYGVTGTVGGIYHGTFLAQGTLNIPLFQESKLRGDRDVADAAVKSSEAQLANFHNEIEAQVRDSMLDVSATAQMIKVARSNVDLAHSALNDATDRFQNGIDDDLPVVQAQTSLAAAQTQLVDSLYHYDKAKLALARSVGIIDRQFRTYLGPSIRSSDSGGLHYSSRSLAPTE